MNETTYVNITLQASGWTMGTRPDVDVERYNPVWTRLLKRPEAQPQKSEDVFFQQLWLPNYKYEGKEYSFNINSLAPQPHKSSDFTWYQRRAHFFAPEMCDCLCIVGPPSWDDLYVAGVAPYLAHPVPKGIQDHKGPLPIVFLGLGPATSEFEVKILQKTAETRSKYLNYYCSFPALVTPESIEKLLELFLLIRGKAVSGSIMDWEIVSDLGPIPKTLTIKRGNGLAIADMNGKSDPYCKFGIGTGIGAWKVGPWDPKKDHSVMLIDFAKYRQFDIFIEVWDEDLVGSDRLGYCSIPVAQLSNGKHVLPVKSVKNEKASGTIAIEIGIEHQDFAKKS